MPGLRGRTAVILHGSGSDAAFVHSAFEIPFARLGIRLVAPDDRTGDPVAMGEWLRRYVASDADVRVVGGVSVGAHAAARWAAHDVRARSLHGLVLVMPAWTGEPGSTAQLTAAAARQVRREGVAAELVRMSLDAQLADDWVFDELRRAWPLQAETLAQTLRATSESRGPFPSELAQITTPTALIALDDDPLHPSDVARRWSEVIRTSAVARIGREAPKNDREVFGELAVALFRRLGVVKIPPIGSVAAS